jgi:hypothetical protein
MRPDEAEPAGGAAVDPGGGAVRVGRADGVALADLDAALLQEGAQGLAEVGVAVGRDVELACQGLGLERLVVLVRQVREDLLREVRHWHRFGGTDSSVRARCANR